MYWQKKVQQTHYQYRMDFQEKEVIRTSLTELSESITCSSKLIDYLHQYGVLSKEDMEEIVSGKI